MRRFLFMCIIAFPLLTAAQSSVKDNTNNGQMKRMVFKKWNDWSGYNKLVGWIYWRIVHRSYKNGGDLRPYRVGGPYEQNYASLVLQDKQDGNIMDLTNEAYKTHVATYENMSGGSFDLPYTLYFKKKLGDLLGEILGIVGQIKTSNSLGYDYIVKNLAYQDYLEFIEIQKDRVSIIHQSFVDKGERINAYMAIKTEIEKRNAAMLPLIYNLFLLAKIPSSKEVRDIQRSSHPPAINTDKVLVQDILKHYKF